MKNKKLKNLLNAQSESKIIWPNDCPLPTETTKALNGSGPKTPTPLVLGSPALDKLLSDFAVPRGSLVYLNCHSEVAPYAVLFATALAALERGQRVTFVTIPHSNPFENKKERSFKDADLRSGRIIWPHLATWQTQFGLDRYANPKNPSDPQARLRYLPANDFEQLDKLLQELTSPRDSSTVGNSPDLILIYGIEYLFHPALSINGGWGLMGING